MKRIIFIIILLAVFGILISGITPVNAYSFSDIKGFYGRTGDSTGFDTAKENSIYSIVATIITALLSLVGAVFVILFIYSGVSWMTSGGNDEKISKAKKTMVYAVVGLIIIFVSYSITLFVSQNLVKGTDVSGRGGAESTDCTGDGGVCMSSDTACRDSGGEPSITGPGAESCSSGVCCFYP